MPRTATSAQPALSSLRTLFLEMVEATVTLAMNWRSTGRPAAPNPEQPSHRQTPTSPGPVAAHSEEPTAEATRTGQALELADQHYLESSPSYESLRLAAEIYHHCRMRRKAIQAARRLTRLPGLGRDAMSNSARLLSDIRSFYGRSDSTTLPRILHIRAEPQVQVRLRRCG